MYQPVICYSTLEDFLTVKANIVTNGNKEKYIDALVVRAMTHIKLLVQFMISYDWGYHKKYLRNFVAHN